MVASATAKILNILSQLLITAILARMFDAETFGLWMTFFHYIGLLSICDLGIGGGGFRNALVTTPSQNRQALFFSSFYIMFFLYLVLFALLFFISLLFSLNLFPLNNVLLAKKLPLITFIFLLSLLIKIPFSISSTGFLAFEEVSLKAYLDMIESALSLICIAIVFYLNSSFTQTFSTYFFCIAATSFLGFIFFLLKRGWRWQKPIFYECIKLKSLFSTHLFFWAQNLSSLFLFSLSPALISAKVGLVEAGSFSLVYRGCLVALGVHFALLNPLWTKYTQAFHSRNHKQLFADLFFSLKISLLYFSLFSIFFLFTYNHLIYLWTGKNIEAPHLVFSLIIWTFFYGMINTLSIFLNALNQLKQQVLFLFLGALSFLLSASTFGKESSQIILYATLSLLPLLFSNIFEIRKIYAQNTYH